MTPRCSFGVLTYSNNQLMFALIVSTVHFIDEYAGKWNRAYW